MKNFIEEKTEGRKLNLEERKQKLKNDGTHIPEEKSARKFEVHHRKGRMQKNGVDKIQCDD